VSYLGGKEFQRDLAIKQCVSREIDLTHAARAKRGKNFIVSERFAGGNRHLLDVQLSTGREANKVVLRERPDRNSIENHGLGRSTTIEPTRPAGKVTLSDNSALLW
jgi:hypothetical protein